jgi:predicted MFS family arabinose efflux permease
MASALALIWLLSLFLLKQDLGKAKSKPKFRELFSKSRAINILSAARLFLFGARDVWFVVALPVFLASQLQWDFWWVGGFLASWVIGYGIVQSFAPRLLKTISTHTPDGRSAFGWALALGAVTAGIAACFYVNLGAAYLLIIGLIIFGICFAINSSIHSYLIVRYAKQDGVSLDVGFYYMANAMGRLLGTILSGWIYQAAGMELCLWISALFIGIAAILSRALPREQVKHHD